MGLFDTLSVTGEKVTILNPLCYPNSWVTGVFSFSVKNDVPMRAIRIHFEGKEMTYIVTRNKKSSTRHTATNFLVQQYLVVSGATKSNPSSDVTLKPGDYAIPFQFLIPSNAPVSGAQRTPNAGCNVEYTVTGNIDIPFGKDAESSAMFQVGVCMPVEQLQHLSHPVGTPTPQVVPVTCCCCSKGSVTFTATVDTGVILLDRPGTVNVTMTVDNSKGEEPVDAVTASVINLLTVRTQTLMRQIRAPLASAVSQTKIAPGQSSELRLSIPCTIPPTFMFPTWGGVNTNAVWFVEVELDIPYATDPKMLIPIVAAQHLDESNQAPPLNVALPDIMLQQGQPGAATPLRADPNMLIEYRYSLPGALEGHAKGLSMLPPLGPGGIPAPYAQQPNSFYA